MAAAIARRADLTDLDLARAVAGGDESAARLVIKRHNQRLFRVAWSVLRSRAEAEEAMQEAYLKAFASIDRYRGASSLSTWLTRIVLNEAISRARASARRARDMKADGLSVLDPFRLRSSASFDADPEKAVMRNQLGEMLQRAVAQLPEAFRLVFVLSEVEGLSRQEVAALIGAPEETVRTRLFRARRRLRETLGPQLGESLGASLAFAGADCDRLTVRVLAAWRSKAH